MLRFAASLAVLAALMGPAAAAPFRLIVTDLEAPLVPNSVMDLAVSLGYFERENVEVELVRVQQTPLAITALQAGEGEMANIGVDSLLQLVASDQLDLRAVMSPSKSLAFMIVARDSISDVASLAGKSFGVGRIGSVDQTLSRQVLANQGVDVDGLNLVALGQPAARAQALAAAQIDATTMSLGTWTTLPDQSGMKVLIDQDAYFKAAPVVSKVNVMLPETIETRRPEVVAVVTALTKLARDISEDPQIWINAMADLRPDLDRAALESLAAAYSESWSVNAGLSAADLNFTADWNFKSADFADLKPIELSRWVDFSIADEVLKNLGTMPTMDPADR